MQAGLSLCWSHIQHCWKSHVVAQNIINWRKHETRHIYIDMLFEKQSSVLSIHLRSLLVTLTPFSLTVDDNVWHNDCIWAMGNFALLFNCMPVGRTSDSMMVPT